MSDMLQSGCHFDHSMDNLRNTSWKVMQQTAKTTMCAQPALYVGDVQDTGDSKKVMPS